MRWLLPLLLVTGCADQALVAMRDAEGADQTRYDNAEQPYPTGDDGVAAGGDDDDADPLETLGVLWTDPAPGSAEHHYRRPVRVGFDAYAAGARVRVLDAYGAELPALVTWSADYGEATAWPLEIAGGYAGLWLAPSASYSVEVEVGGASLSWGFSTSAVGVAVDVDAATADAFALSFAAVRSDGLPALEAALVAQDGWRLQLRGVDGLYGVDAATADDDGCHPTRALLASPSVTVGPGAYFASTPGPLSLPLGGATLLLEQAEIDGDLGPDAASLVEVGVRGWLRADSLPVADPCSWLAGHGGACQTCPSGDGDCQWIDLGGVSGVALDGALPPAADPDADCSADPGTLGCATGGRGWSALALLALIRRRRG